MTPIQPEIFYVADPMCSWCWGFSPVIDGLHETYSERARISLVVGGLRVGGTHILTNELKEKVVHHWHQVEDSTGQPFNFEFNVPENFVYDTEPSCRATVSVRKLMPQQAFPYFTALHRAFYVDNRDITQTSELADLAEGIGVERNEFETLFESEEIKRETSEDFAFVQGLGITGFPAVVLKDGRGMALLNLGYQHRDHIEPKLLEWLDTGDVFRKNIKESESIADTTGGTE